MADDDALETEDGTTNNDTTDQPDNGDRDEQRKDTTGRDQQQTDKADDKTFTQADVDRLLADRLARERKKFAGYDDLKKKATEFDKLQDAQKTEVEKLNDQLTASQVELQGFRVAEIRRSAASQVGLDPKLAKFITAADETEALEQATELAEQFKPAEPRAADLKQGARTQPRPTMSRDELIRGLAGHGR